ncbi:MAG: SMC-Scp complex subunit ScpB [Anaerolineae bacterium]
MSGAQDFSQLSLESRIEALIFVAGEPLSTETLARTLECSREEVDQALTRLQQALQGRGLRLTRQGDLVQMTTAPAAAADVRRYLQSGQQTSLSTAALECLAVIAYHQPVTRMQIESIRGVNCDSSLKTLLRLGLVMELDRLDQPGRPITYGTTTAFLRLFGISDLSELPPLPQG